MERDCTGCTKTLLRTTSPDLAEQGGAGALPGAGFAASRRFSQVQGDQSAPGSGPPADAGTWRSGPISLSIDKTATCRNGNYGPWCGQA